LFEFLLVFCYNIGVLWCSCQNHWSH